METLKDIIKAAEAKDSLKESVKKLETGISERINEYILDEVIQDGLIDTNKLFKMKEQGIIRSITIEYQSNNRNILTVYYTDINCMANGVEVK